MRTLWMVAVGALSSALVACGSAPDGSAFETPGGTNDDSGVGGGDTSTGSDTANTDDTHHGGPKDTGGGTETTPPPEDTAPPPVALDNVCDRLAEVVCTSATSSCCASKGIAYDASGCRAGVHAACDAEVAAVGSGSMTFDPSAFDACAAAWKAAESKCSIPILDFVHGYAPCDQLFDGKTAPGGPCTATTDCHADAGGFVECGSTSGTCTEYFIVGKDAPCNYDGSTIHFCNYGLYCSPSGTCREAKATGSTCGGSSDVSCGFGNTCNWGHCAPGGASGAPCYSDLACASWSCTSSGTCTDPDFELATNATCNGTP